MNLSLKSVQHKHTKIILTLWQPLPSKQWLWKQNPRKLKINKNEIWRLPSFSLLKYEALMTCSDTILTILNIFHHSMHYCCSNIHLNVASVSKVMSHCLKSNYSLNLLSPFMLLFSSILHSEPERWFIYSRAFVTRIGGSRSWVVLLSQLYWLSCNWITCRVLLFSLIRSAIFQICEYLLVETM